MLLAAAVALPAWGAEPRAGLQPCRLHGLEHVAWCGSVRRPLDPAQPAGTQIDIHFALLPALARNRKPDPVLFFAGGPGQSAIELAGTVSRLLARLGNRRDVVLIDQRGTGRSAPLRCEDEHPTRPLADSADPARQLARLRDCRLQLQQLPHGNLRHYTTWVAVQDADAVRRQLGVAQVNLVGASYGTRAALEYMRQFPRAVRRAVLDGVAPPDMALPAAAAQDNQAALDAVLAACEADADCHARHPVLRADWRALLNRLPRKVSVTQPFTGTVERITVTRDMVLAAVRAPLYVPALASALPQALDAAAQGRFDALLGLSAALSGGRLGRVAEGMHFSVICSEDMPATPGMPALARPAAAADDRAGADFGDAVGTLYRAVCADWPRAAVPAAFYTVPPATAAVLLLSGGADPATPPRHGARVARALGAKARHVVVPQAGHGVMAIGCMRDVLYRFIDADSDDEALQIDAGCARAVPRPPAFVPVTTDGGKP